MKYLIISLFIVVVVGLQLSVLLMLLQRQQFSNFLCHTLKIYVPPVRNGSLLPTVNSALPHTVLFVQSDVFPFVEDYFRGLAHVVTDLVVVHVPDIHAIHPQAHMTAREWDSTHTVVFTQKLPVSGLERLQLGQRGVVWLNIEQTSFEAHLLGLAQSFLDTSSRHTYADYSSANLKNIVRQLEPGLKSSATQLWPCLPDMPPDFPWDSSSLRHPLPSSVSTVVYLGNDTDFRKSMVLDLSRAAGVRVDYLRGFNEARDSELFRYRVLINLHATTQHTVFEELRCNRCVFQRMVVISEDSEFDHDSHPLSKYIIFAPRSQLAAKVKDVCANYKRYYKELYDHFDPMYEFDALLDYKNSITQTFMGMSI